MTTKITSQVFVCLGDSLTQTSPSVTSALPWPQKLDLALGPLRAAGNQGISGDRVITGGGAPGMLARYNANIHGQAFYGLAFEGGLNDLLAGTTAATLWTTYLALVNAALSDVLKVVALTVPPFKAYAGWTSGIQTQLDLHNANIRALANANLRVVDLYSQMGSLGDPAVLNPLYENEAHDHLHWGDAGGTLVKNMVAAAIAAL